MRSGTPSSVLVAAFLFAPASFGPFPGLFEPLEDPADAARAGDGLLYGVDVSGLDDAERLGWRPDLAQRWVGSWSGADGWAHLREDLAEARAHGATPLVEWYYWGDDIAPACFVRGCDGKTVAAWHAKGVELARVLANESRGRPVVVVVETEFNKNGVGEDFDALLARHLGLLRRAVPHAELYVGFGAWDADGHAEFDRAMAVADGAGMQTLRAATRDDADDLRATAADVLAHVRALRDGFGKPVLLHDLAVSSWGGAGRAQAAVLEDLARLRPELADAGLVGIVWRSMRDEPDFRASEYFGVAERAWGLLDAEGRAKPAMRAWLAMTGARPTPTYAAPFP